MSGPKPVDPAVFGPCTGLALDSRDNTCTRFAVEHVESVDDVYGTLLRRLCVPCADAAPGLVSRRPLTTKPGGYPIEQAAPRPAIVAEVDQQMAAASHALDQMVDMYRRNVPGVDVDAAAVFVLMTKTTVHVYDPVETAQLLSIAIARLGSTPAPAASRDLFAEDSSRAVPHAVAVVTGTQDRAFVAVCVCSTAFTGTTEDDVVSRLDSHIANPDPARFRSANGYEWWQTIGGLLVRVPAGLDIVGALGEGYDPYPREEIEAEYGPLVEVTA